MIARVLVILMGLGLAFGAAEALAPQLAAAEPMPTQTRSDSAMAKVTKWSPHKDVAESGGKGMALLFWGFAVASVGGALFVITRRNLVSAVMGLVGTFVGISAVYMMLYASFLSVVQMLVYAGAIMVLFVFVVMILNRPEDEPVAPSGRLGQVLGGVAILYLVGRLVMLLMKVQAPNPTTAFNAPGPTPEGHGWGSVRAVGTDLFGPGLFVFEAVSILLLIAVVGAIAIARPLHEDQDNEGNIPAGEGHKMGKLLFEVGYGHFLVLAAVLFLIGVAGVLIRRNALIILMSVELMLNAANMTLLTFARMWGDMSGHTFALIVIAVAAAEAAVGLAIVVAVFRGRRNVDVDRLTTLRH